MAGAGAGPAGDPPAPPAVEPAARRRGPGRGRRGRGGRGLGGWSLRAGEPGASASRAPAAPPPRSPVFVRRPRARPPGRGRAQPPLRRAGVVLVPFAAPRARPGLAPRGGPARARERGHGRGAGGHAAGLHAPGRLQGGQLEAEPAGHLPVLRVERHGRGPPAQGEAAGPGGAGGSGAGRPPGLLPGRAPPRSSPRPAAGLPRVEPGRGGRGRASEGAWVRGGRGRPGKGRLLSHVGRGRLAPGRRVSDVPERGPARNPPGVGGLGRGLGLGRPEWKTRQKTTARRRAPGPRVGPVGVRGAPEGGVLPRAARPRARACGYRRRKGPVFELSQVWARLEVGGGAGVEKCGGTCGLEAASLSARARGWEQRLGGGGEGFPGRVRLMGRWKPALPRGRSKKPITSTRH